MIPLTTKLTAICSLLRRVLEMEASPTPYASHGRYIGVPNHQSFIGECRDKNGNWTNEPMGIRNAAFIAAACNITKPQATALLLAIDALEYKAQHEIFPETGIAHTALQSIADAFPDTLFQDRTQTPILPLLRITQDQARQARPSMHGLPVRVPSQLLSIRPKITTPRNEIAP